MPHKRERNNAPLGTALVCDFGPSSALHFPEPTEP